MSMAISIAGPTASRTAWSRRASSRRASVVVVEMVDMQLLVTFSWAATLLEKTFHRSWLRSVAEVVLAIGHRQ